jgi:hypothetical protein
VSHEVLVAVLVTVLVDELTGMSRWAAGRVAQWAARHSYPFDPERAKDRAEEWHELVTESIPTNISALCCGLGLGAAALARMAARRVKALAPLGHHALRLVPGTDGAGRRRRERQIAERRTACIDLVRAASELKIQALCAGDDTGRLRQQAASTQVQAAAVALLAPDPLAESAERLAVAAGCIADAAAAHRGADRSLADSLRELDESIRAFRAAAVDMFRDLLQISPAPQGRSPR